MASSSNYPNWLKVALTVGIILSQLYLLSQTVGVEFSSYDSETLEERQKLIGSRPPGCVNKCSTCRPCVATLVIPPHQKKGLKASNGEHDSYYLLSWKCKCGNRLFQP
ncbi:unnamed protein product [Ilex paraguariensis]|uniref:Epidermal patterning factor-like protein n=1 Tax=Ilex paraguariensis TaxID=185542 RepID=A0ABC8UK16_9AQUA